MLASVHLADVGPSRTLALLAKGPSRIVAPGLRNANLALAARLGGPLLTKPDPGRIALVAMWDDDAALDQFLADAPIARELAGGWSTRLEPLRAWGSWPGLPDDLPKKRTVEHDGPVAVSTMGRVRVARLVPFLRASAKAEALVVRASGLIWGTALARPPFVSTFSLWESSDAARAYAFSPGDAHDDAIAAGRAKPFHHQEAFIRFRPYATTGHLDGRNPLPESAIAGAGA
jgi:hypothetical protein